MTETPTFFESVAKAEDAARVQQWGHEKALEGIEGLEIGMLYLRDGQSLYLSVHEGAISRFGEVITEIPSLEVVRSSEALAEHIRSETSLDVDRLEVIESDREELEEAKERPVDTIRRRNPGKFIPTGEEYANLLREREENLDES